MRILWISVDGHDERELGDLDGACKSVGAGEGVCCQLLDGRLARVELNLPWNEMRATYGGRARTLSPTLTSQMFSPVTPNELIQQRPSGSPSGRRSSRCEDPEGRSPATLPERNTAHCSADVEPVDRWFRNGMRRYVATPPKALYLTGAGSCQACRVGCT